MSSVSIAGSGCSLIDYLFSGVDFESPTFQSFCSKGRGDGGLAPGMLVFTEELETFAGRPLAEILASITGGRDPDSRNLGGPAIVALAGAAQLLGGSSARVSFHGAVGDDRAGDELRSIIRRTPVETSCYRTVEGSSPCTYVLSDPRYHGGHGERTFINNLGAAGKMLPTDLSEEFFSADIQLFGATGLVPHLHDGLTELVRRTKAHDRISVVSTVYDFRSERANPHRRWPLGASDETYRHTDLLVTDREEALRLSGTAEVEAAVSFFKRRGVSAFVCTNGPEPVRFYSDGRLFARAEGALPVSAAVGSRLRTFTGKGDTTGCGDNFVGGLLASMARQLEDRRPGKLDLPSACSLGIVSGGFACFYLGGTYIERELGEKRRAIAELYNDYRGQVAERFAIEPLEVKA